MKHKDFDIDEVNTNEVQTEMQTAMRMTVRT